MLPARELWDKIMRATYAYAEPGVIFIDEVNRNNHMIESMGPIYATNPCAEQALHFNNSCNLGSIDLAKFYDPETRLDWERLADAVLQRLRALLTWPARDRVHAFAMLDAYDTVPVSEATRVVRGWREGRAAA